MSQPTVTAIAPWAGGKRTLAARIVEALGPHRVYWGLCCGSMAVELAKPPAKMETVVDLHGDVLNLANVIRDVRLGSTLYRWLRRTLMHEAIFAESDAWLREEPGCPTDLSPTAMVERAYHYFIVSWLGRNGSAGMSMGSKGTYCVRYTANGGHAGTRWANAIQSIPTWRRRLERLTILRRDIFEIMPRIEDATGTAIYVDPPYLAKGFKYLHDFDGDAHQRMAVALARFRNARVVVSYYDDPQLADLYPPTTWSRQYIEVSKAMAHQGQRGKNDTRATEVLLINEPAEQKGLFA